MSNPSTQKQSGLLSIITVVYNGAEFIEKTIKSVIEQDSENIEYIIVDGGSNDGTVDIIERYDSQIDFWISEKDNGIYDAMNKALSYVHGAAHLFLNAGDYFVGKVFNSEIQYPCFLDVYYINFFNSFKRIKIKNHRLGLPNCHQGIIFETKGIKYNPDYKISADYQYYIDHGYGAKLPKLRSDGYVYFDNTGTNKKYFKLRDNEIKTIIKLNYGFFWCCVFSLKVSIKNFIRVIFRKI